MFANLKPRKLAGIPSNGMVLCASGFDGETIKTELLRPVSSDCPIGSRLVLSNAEIKEDFLEYLPKLNPKKKVERVMLMDLKVDRDGILKYNGERQVMARDSQGTYYGIGAETLRDCDVS